MGEKFEWIHFSSLAFQVNRTTTHLHRHIMALFFHFLVSASSKFLSHMLQYYMQRFMIFFRENVIFFFSFRKKMVRCCIYRYEEMSKHSFFLSVLLLKKKNTYILHFFPKMGIFFIFFLYLLYILRRSTQVKVTSSS